MCRRGKTADVNPQTFRIMAHYLERNRDIGHTQFFLGEPLGNPPLLNETSDELMARIYRMYSDYTVRSV